MAKFFRRKFCRLPVSAMLVFQMSPKQSNFCVLFKLFEKKTRIQRKLVVGLFLLICLNAWNVPRYEEIDVLVGLIFMK